MNGLAIAAYARYAQASGDEAALDRAKKAAEHTSLATHMTPSGALSHDKKPEKETGDAHVERIVHLADNAAFAWGLLAIGETAQAVRIADALLKDLQDERGGGFFAHSKDPDAVGVFAARRKPFEDNVMMLRVLAKLAKVAPEKAAIYKRAIDRTLRAVATPDRVKDRGRMVGDFLMALDETKDVR